MQRSISTDLNEMVMPILGLAEECSRRPASSGRSVPGWPQADRWR
jgi:hypothetical protein